MSLPELPAAVDQYSMSGVTLNGTPREEHTESILAQTRPELNGISSSRQRIRSSWFIHNNRPTTETLIGGLFFYLIKKVN